MKVGFISFEMGINSDEHDAKHGARSGMDQATARSVATKSWPSSRTHRTERSRPVM